MNKKYTATYLVVKFDVTNLNFLKFCNYVLAFFVVEYALEKSRKKRPRKREIGAVEEMRKERERKSTLPFTVLIG